MAGTRVQAVRAGKPRTNMRLRTAPDAGETIRSERHVSIKRLSELTGFDRGTISKWVKAGCPVVSKGARGDDYRLDIREVWLWRERQAAEQATKALAGEPGGELLGGWMGIKDPFQVLKAQQKMMEIGLERGRSVYREPMEMAIERAFGLVKQGCMSIPDRIARQMAGFPRDRVDAWRLQAKEFVRDTLNEAAKAIEEAVPEEVDVEA